MNLIHMIILTLVSQIYHMYWKQVSQIILKLLKQGRKKHVDLKK